jgi:hypothetical protein
MFRRHPRHPERSGKATAELQRRADAEAVNCVDASEYQAASDAGEPWLSQRTLAIDPPDISSPAPEVSLENQRTQGDQVARLYELLTRADQAAQRMAAQQAERRASSEYAVPMELEAQTQPRPVGRPKPEMTSSLSCYAAA